MKRRINSLDLLRSIAILLVLMAHIIYGFGAPDNLAPLQLGGIGVDLFFVLSGWLLGSVLFQELTNDRIDIGRFWTRRWMRTLPAYYAVLSLTMLQQIVTKDDPALRWDYYIFIQNYDTPLDIFYVSWSLAVEEQFYLFIAPCLFYLGKLSKTRRIAILLILLLTPSVLRYLNLYSDPNETHVRLDGCMMGVLLACIKYEHEYLWKAITKYSKFAIHLSIVLFVLFFYQRWVELPFISDPGPLTRSLIFGVWVVYANSSEKVRTGLNVPGSYYVATRSYALYLLHPDAIAIVNRMFSIESILVYSLVVLLISLAFSEILYRTVELPFMRLRDKVPYVRRSFA